MGFRKIDLQSGAGQRVSVALDCGASNHPFSYFQPANETDLRQWTNGAWVTPSGQFTVHVGTSSAQTTLESGITLNLANCTTATSVTSAAESM